MINCYWSVPDVRTVSHNSGFSQRRLSPDIAAAKEFLQQQWTEVADLKLQDIDRQLWELWQDAIAQEDAKTQYGAELCLRCRISNEISNSCLELVTQFKDQQITWDELFTCLPYDDVLQLNRNRANGYQPFTIEILRAYNPHRSGDVSLANLVKQRVRQNKAVLKYLLDHNILLRSDWALLNRARLSGLTAFEVAIVKVFHAVYRDDRRHKHTSRTDGKCLPPISQQLQAMLDRLQKQNIVIESQTSLLESLTKIALSLRKQEIAKLRGFPITESLDKFDQEEEANTPREVPDESKTNNPFEAVAQKAFEAFCKQLEQYNWNLQAEIDISLAWGVERGICDRITILKNKSKRAYLADWFEVGLYLTYCEGLTQTEIGAQLNIPQWKVAKLLDLENLNQRCIPEYAAEKLFRQIVQMIQALELSINASTPDYKRDLISVLHEFLAPIFKEAEAERRNPKTRQKTSRLAKHIQTFLRNRRS